MIALIDRSAKDGSGNLPTKQSSTVQNAKEYMTDHSANISRMYTTKEYELDLRTYQSMLMHTKHICSDQLKIQFTKTKI